MSLSVVPSLPADFPPTRRYRPVRLLGSGASGVVFEVTDEATGQRAALKALRHPTPEGIYRLKREFRARSQLSHPNLVTFHELSNEGDAWFLVMDLVEGAPFSAFCRGEPAELASAPLRSSATMPVAELPLPPCPADLPRLQSALLQLARGLQALHDGGLIHRDLKPDNVLVAPSGQLCILDFGFALALRETALREADDPRAGTPAYLSPEQAAGGDPSPASDWYAVGVMLYEALTGRLPFSGDTQAILQAKITTSPQPPGAVVAGAPEPLQQLCMSLLARDPAARPDGTRVLGLLGGGSAELQETAAAPHSAALQPLDQAWARAQQGEAVFVLVSGRDERRVVGEFLFRQRRLGVGWPVEARCDAREKVPFNAFDALFDALERKQPGGPPRHITPDLTPAALIDLLRRWIEELSAQRKLILYLDRIEEADAASLSALGGLMEHPPRGSVLMLLGLAVGRESEVSSQVKAALGAARELVRVSVSEETNQPPKAEARLPAGTVLGGQYTIKHFLAEGAMGAVYKAEEQGGRAVALKTLHYGSSTALFQRFFREIRLAVTLSHPNIVAVYRGGRDEKTGLAFMAMELLDGEDLASLLARTGPLPEAVAVRLAVQIAEAVAVAHEADVVHRDIKPANIFLHRAPGGEVVVKVCDFGVAKSLDPSEQGLTRTGTLIGSPMYMAPEALLNAKEADARGDVWSLAMSLYEVLSGACPTARARTMSELILMVTTEDMPPLQEQAPWVSPEVAAAVQGALLRDKEARCPSMRELAAKLTPFARVGPLTLDDLRPLRDDERARKAPAAPRSRRWERVLKQAEAPRDPLLGRSLAGKYTLGRRLGEGGMGAVYQATADGGDVAIKVIRPDLPGVSVDAMRRFVREARVSMSIRSPHVVHVREVDTDASLGAPYIVMDLLRGSDLSSLIADQGALPPPLVSAIFLQACAGVGAAHEVGVVHRDIKPANIFLHQQDDQVTVKVCDFGIAKKTFHVEGEESTADLTKTGGMLGSPLYMSPEQARNAKDVDVRTDVWSLCISMYEALAGQKPWPSLGSLGEIIYTLTTKDVPPLLDVAPWVPEPLAEIVHRGLHREPSQRWASVRELADALRPLASATLSTSALAGVSAEIKSEARSTRRPAAIRAATSADSLPPTTPGATTASTRPRWMPWLVGAVALGAVGVGVAMTSPPRPPLPASRGEGEALSPALSTVVERGLPGASSDPASSSASASASASPSASSLPVASTSASAAGAASASTSSKRPGKVEPQPGKTEPGKTDPGTKATSTPTAFPTQTGWR